jgi:hypothetical protein
MVGQRLPVGGAMSGETPAKSGKKRVCEIGICFAISTDNG